MKGINRATWACERIVDSRVLSVSLSLRPKPVPSSGFPCIQLKRARGAKSIMVVERLEGGDKLAGWVLPYVTLVLH